MRKSQLGRSAAVTVGIQSIRTGGPSLKQKFNQIAGRFALTVTLVVAALAGGAVPASAAEAPGLLDQFTVRSISSRPEMVSGGDAIVQVRIPSGADMNNVRIWRGTSNLTGTFETVPGSPGLIQAKVPVGSGDSVIRATLPGYTTQRLTLVNHALSGPILSGRHLNPLVCNTATAGLGAPQDANCTGNTVVTYRYRTNGNGWQNLADPTGPVPGNIKMTTTTDGKEVPFAVATERGTLNRSIYALSTLVDIGPGSDPAVAGEGFNGTAIYGFGGGCNNSYFQANSGGGNPNINVGEGYAFMQSSLNAFGQRCSDAMSAETVSMVKERFIENWGPIEKTLGNGGSGGSMAQQMIANNYPGLLDALTLTNSFMDNAYATGNLIDCARVGSFVDAAGWIDAEKHAVLGGGVTATCATTVGAFADGFFNPQNCPASVPAADRYNALTNPLGIRCTVWDANSNLWGKLPNGRAKQAADNVGVQYGLEALLSDAITPEQFLALNAGVGGISDNGEVTASRREADPEALKIAYEMGQLNEGSAGYASTPAIDNRQYVIETVPNGHQIIHALSMQERLEESTGAPVPHSVWTSTFGPGDGVDDEEPADPTVPSKDVWAILDQWVDAIRSDTSDLDPQAKAVAHTPAAASDRCFNDDGSVMAVEAQTLDSGVCGAAFPSHKSPRMIAGGSLANDILKCALKPVDPADYEGQLSAGQLEELEEIFPTGVCDWDEPGVEQSYNTDTWRAWPTGQPDSSAPATTISSGPVPSAAPATVDFEFSSSETGSQFECRIDSDDAGDFERCQSPVRFGPLADGVHRFEVRATDTAGNAGEPAGMNFSVGDSAPVLAVSPAAFGFGPINVGGELGEPGEFSLNNPGTEPVQLDDAVLSGSGAGSFKILPNGSTCYFLEPAGLIAPGETCTVVVIFDPESEGTKRASLGITSDSVTSPEELPLSGTGFPELLPGATLTPQALSFGNQQPGTSSAARTVTLTSSGTGDLDIGPVTLAGDNPDQFTISSNNCSSRVMASGDSCQIQVVFNPVGTGARSASFTVFTDATGADTTVDLTGNGASPPVVNRNSRVLTGGSIPRLMRSKTQAVPLRCFTTNMDWCRGRITLRARGRALGLRHNRLVSIGSRSYSLKRGNRTVRVRLGNRARRQIQRRSRLQVRVITTSRQGNGSFRTANASRRLRR